MYEITNLIFLDLQELNIFFAYMHSKPEIKRDIINTSRRLFFSRGYKKVTVDEIAAAMSISKKTVYKYYNSKREILEKVFDDYKKNITDTINQILDRKQLPFSEKLKQVMSGIGLQLGGLHPILFRDIQENIPELWEKIDSYKKEAAFLRFNKLIEEGRKKGQVKTDINRAVAVALYASAIENLMDPAFMRTLPAELSDEIPPFPSDVFDQALKIIFEGILTHETVLSLT